MVPKRAKSSISGQNHEVVPVPKQGGTGTTIQNPFGTGTTIQNPFGTGTKTSSTGTTIQNVFSTGTKHSGTGTIVSKSPDFCSFAYLSPNSYTVSIGTLINY